MPGERPIPPLFLGKNPGRRPAPVPGTSPDAGGPRGDRIVGEVGSTASGGRRRLGSRVSFTGLLLGAAYWSGKSLETVRLRAPVPRHGTAKLVKSKISRMRQNTPSTSRIYGWGPVVAPGLNPPGSRDTGAVSTRAEEDDLREFVWYHLLKRCHASAGLSRVIVPRSMKSSSLPVGIDWRARQRWHGHDLGYILVEPTPDVPVPRHRVEHGDILSRRPDPGHIRR